MPDRFTCAVNLPRIERAADVKMALTGHAMRKRSKLFLATAGGMGLLCCVYAFSQRRPAASVAGTRQRLARTVVSLDPRITTFASAVAALEKQSGVTFVVRWQELADRDVHRGSHIAVHPGNTTAERALSTLLLQVREFDYSPVELSYYIDDQGRVVVTSCLDALERSATLRVYEVGDLVRAGPTHDEAADTIEKIITQNAEMETWKDFGGTVGTYYLCGNKLCIVQSQEIHVKVAQLIDRMREEVSQTGKLPKPPEAPTFGVP
ncbi:MAG TPA: hypothetical protein VG269_29065 [Tepidisphaeraceae bacterium]|jgi:hypothetical protein|nr:hypothetical protein [Tepidisphaeraceae bacterium]